MPAHGVRDGATDVARMITRRQLSALVLGSSLLYGGQIIFRNSLDPDNVDIQSITWTKQTKAGTWPATSGYTSILYDPFTERTIFYFPVTSNTIYGSDIFAYNAATNTFEQHPNGNGTQSTNDACAAAGGTVGIERTVADDGYIWPEDRHPEQMAIDTSRHVLWVWSGVCRGFFDSDPEPSHSDRIFKFNLNATLSSATWTKLSTTSVEKCEQEGEMVYSPDDDVLFCYGGLNGATGIVYCPTESSLTAAQTAAGCSVANDWNVVTFTGGTTPNVWRTAGMWYDTATDKVILYGGKAGTDASSANETWAYDIPTQTWTNKSPSNPPPLYDLADGGDQPSMAYDTSRNKFLYRQLAGTGAPKDWTYDPVANTWTELVTSSTGPDPDSPVNLFLMAYDAANDVFVAVVYNPASDSANHPSIWKGRWR